MNTDDTPQTYVANKKRTTAMAKTKTDATEQQPSAPPEVIHEKDYRKSSRPDFDKIQTKVTGTVVQVGKCSLHNGFTYEVGMCANDTVENRNASYLYAMKQYNVNRKMYEGPTLLEQQSVDNRFMNTVHKEYVQVAKTLSREVALLRAEEKVLLTAIPILNEGHIVKTTIQDKRDTLLLTALPSVVAMFSKRKEYITRHSSSKVGKKHVGPSDRVEELSDSHPRTDSVRSNAATENAPF